MNCFRPGQQSTVFPTAPLGLVFPGDQSCSASGYSDHYDHIGPRVGFAYAPSSSADKNFVIRGGFGIYFNRSEEELTLQNVSAAPFSLTSYGIAGAAGALGIANPSPSFANPYSDIATGLSMANPFPFTPAKKGSAVDFSPYLPLDINTIDPKFTAPYAMNYNLFAARVAWFIALPNRLCGVTGTTLGDDLRGQPHLGPRSIRVRGGSGLCSEPRQPACALSYACTVCTGQYFWFSGCASFERALQL